MNRNSCILYQGLFYFHFIFYQGKFHFCFIFCQGLFHSVRLFHILPGIFQFCFILCKGLFHFVSIFARVISILFHSFSGDISFLAQKHLTSFCGNNFPKTILRLDFRKFNNLHGKCYDFKQPNRLSTVIGQKSNNQIRDQPIRM